MGYLLRAEVPYRSAISAAWNMNSQLPGFWSGAARLFGRQQPAPPDEAVLQNYTLRDCQIGSRRTGGRNVWGRDRQQPTIDVLVEAQAPEGPDHSRLNEFLTYLGFVRGPVHAAKTIVTAADSLEISFEVKARDAVPITLLKNEILGLLNAPNAGMFPVQHEIQDTTYDRKFLGITVRKGVGIAGYIRGPERVVRHLYNIIEGRRRTIEVSIEREYIGAVIGVPAGAPGAGPAAP